MSTATPSDSRNSKSVTTFILPDTVRDATLNSSNKTWTVPTGSCWKLHWAHVILVTTATVGNRVLRLDIEDGSGNLVMDAHSGVVQAASLTQHYEFMQGIYRETAFANSSVQVPLPLDLYIPEGYVLRIWDTAAIAAAADDMTVSFQYTEFLTP